MAPQPDRKTGRIPTEEELARWQRVRPIMNELLQGAGLVKVAEDKVLVTGLKGPPEEGWWKKVGHSRLGSRSTRRAPATVLRRRGPSRPPVNGGAMPALNELRLRGKIAGPGPVTNLFLGARMGAGYEVTVHGGHLLLKPLTSIPAMRRGLRHVMSLRKRPEFRNPRRWVNGVLAAGAAVAIRRGLHRRASA